MGTKLVIREQYLGRLERSRDDTDVVKVITGVRRCGKSTLLMQFMNRLRDEGVSDDNILYANFESKSMNSIIDYHDLEKWVEERTVTGRMYIFLDEIQRVEG